MIAEKLLTAILTRHIAADIRLRGSKYVSGGCINTTIKAATDQGDYFIKINGSQERELFEKEYLGLKLLKEASTIQTPNVLGQGIFENQMYLLLQWIDKGRSTKEFWQRFGLKLSQQHKVTKEAYGLAHNNHIGRLHQSNTFHPQWYDFFIQERLLPQIKLATENHLIDKSIRTQFDRLFKDLTALIPQEPPALLHGDLWGGNFLCTVEEEPCIFDPAVYFGHRETELAFTTLFGGFDKLFYDSYYEASPLAPGFHERIDIHNLYPLLVHVNLFGSSYLSGIKSTLGRFT